MSRFLYATVVEDDRGKHHQFHAFNELELNKLVADWTRARWKDIFGECPADDGECIEVYFDWQSTYADPGFAHELWALDPIPLAPVFEVCGACGRDYRGEDPPVTGSCPSDDCPSLAAEGEPAAPAFDPVEIDRIIDDWHEDRIPGELPAALGWTREQYARWVETGLVPVGEPAGMPRSFLPGVLTAVAGNACYPIEIMVNGELSFKLDSEDAEGDLKAIRALMEFRTARRQNRPLTSTELYGTASPDAFVYYDKRGRIVHIEDRAKPLHTES